jgi:hypothetical protein
VIVNVCHRPSWEVTDRPIDNASIILGAPPLRARVTQVTRSPSQEFSIES